MKGNIQCSTPFGIKDCCTRRQWQARRGNLPVLNAFRHQRLLHDKIERRSDAASTSSAQRLSASKIAAQYPCNYLFF